MNSKKTLEETIKTYETKILEAAIEAAKQGYGKAQLDVAKLYYDGKNTEKEYRLAFYWFRRAAKQGYTEAKENLGFMYYLGHGVKKDHGKALYWFTKINRLTMQQQILLEAESDEKTQEYRKIIRENEV